MILWNHRWEYDKGPAAFFAALDVLVESKLQFRLAVCGEQFSQVPEVFAEAHARLVEAGVKVECWGYLDTRAEYLELLRGATIAVSSADHEFFGISMVEAMHAGAYPLVPDRLAYPEIFPKEFRYADGSLGKRLKAAVSSWFGGAALRADRRGLSGVFSSKTLLPKYTAALRALLD